ncbi:MAG: FCD domain-containing protein [Candidatus Thiodiazotropha sp.]
MPQALVKQNGERTIASTLTDAIRKDIISGELAPNSKLKLRELTERYGAGVIPLREALSRLALSGFVIAVDQKGFRVTGISEAELNDITKLRQQLESDALRDAIENGDLDWESRVLAALHRVSKIPIADKDSTQCLNPEWETAHVAFHETLISACSSKWLLRFTRVLRDQTARYRAFSFHCRTPTKRSVAKEHEKIVQATLDRDADKACSLLQAHFRKTSELALEQIKQLKLDSDAG